MIGRDRPRIEVLGELRILDGAGEVVELPASRKTRALLAYLVLTGRRHHRSQLCDLLWDGIDDPRGALRWSLSRLRAALDREDAPVIESDRRTIGLATDRITVDLFEARALVPAREEADTSLEALRGAAKLFRGELLEGLELLDAFRFHSWCAAEREAARAFRASVLSALSSRVSDPDEALLHAHHLVSIDPLDEEAQARVVRLLTRAGRHSDAAEQWHAYRRMLELELGEVPPHVASRMRRLVHTEPVAAAQPTPIEPMKTSASVPFVGRSAELGRLESWAFARDDPSPLCVVAGAPGEGKTRLVAELVAVARREGARVLTGRAYSAETLRAFGAFRDILADVEGAESVFSSIADAGADPRTRSRLFDDLVRVLSGARPRSSRSLLLVVLDDLQWLDETSAAFMHYLVRRTTPAQLKIVATVRPAEMMDNPTVLSIVSALEVDDQVLKLTLGPLDHEAVAEISSALGDVDPADVWARSEGNAFVAVEAARALARGETSLPENVGHLVEGRLRLVGGGAKELLPWAAALGRTFSVDVLEKVTGLDPLSLVERVGELEARGVLEPRGDDGYDFTHELVREAAYREVSGPRRRMIHRSIARTLDDATDPSELLRHAELGGERAIACRASVAAARSALSVCAWVDACAAADRGLQYTDALEEEERLDALLSLLECRVSGGSILQRPHPPHVTSAIEDALAMDGDPKQKFKALYFRFMGGLEHGTKPDDEQTVNAAADVSRLADPETEARQLANSARCLLHLERDVSQARSLLAEAESALGDLGLSDVELHWARGLLARWDGEFDRATAEMERAMELARSVEDRWREASCKRTLIRICLEAGRLSRVSELAEARLDFEGDEAPAHRSPFIDAIIALADVRKGGGSDERLAEALDLLRAREAWVQASWVLADLARMHYERGDLDAAEEAAREAAERAEAARRSVALTDALCTLTRLHLDRGDPEAGRETLSRAMISARGEDALPKLVQHRLAGLVAELS